MPARTRSTIRLRSSSAMAPTMTTMSPAQRAGGVDVFPERDVLDVEPVELVEDIEEVLDRPGHPIRSPDQDNVEAAAAGIAHHLIETGPPGLRTADSVGVFVDDLDSRAGRPSAGGRAAGSLDADRQCDTLIYSPARFMRACSFGLARVPFLAT